MVAYIQKNDDPSGVPVRRKKLSHELFHGLSPEEFDREAKSLADAEGMTPSVRSRIEEEETPPSSTVPRSSGNGWWFPRSSPGSVPPPCDQMKLMLL